MGYESDPVPGQPAHCRCPSLFELYGTEQKCGSCPWNRAPGLIGFRCHVCERAKEYGLIIGRRHSRYQCRELVVIQATGYTGLVQSWSALSPSDHCGSLPSTLVGQAKQGISSLALRRHTRVKLEPNRTNGICFRGNGSMH